MVAIDVGANHPAVEAEHRLLGADQRRRFVVGRAAVRGAVFSPRLHITRFDTHPELEPSAAGARRVVGVRGITGPAAD